MQRFELRAGPVLFWSGCFVLLAAARLCHSGVLWADEAYGMAGARRILEGAALYREVWFDKPPLYAWVYLPWGAQAGWVLRFAGALFALLCCWLAARTAKELFGPREAYAAAAAMAFFLSFDHPVAILSLAPDFLLIPFALGSVWAIAGGRAGLAGAIAASGLLAHTKAAVLPLLLLLWQPRGWKRLIPAYAVTATVVWILARGWEEPVWMWGLFYAGDTFLEHPFAEGIRRTVNWAGFHAALVLGAAAFLWKAHPLRWRLALWLLLSFAAVCAGARFFPRYYLALLPALTVAAARGFSRIPRRWLTPLLAVTLLIPAVRFGVRHAAIWRNHPGAMRDLILSEDCHEAAVRIRALARRGDTLFVWGYRPELNVLAGLPGATPFLDSQPLTGVPADRHLMRSEPALPELAARNRARLTQTTPTFVADGLGPLNPQLAIDRFPDLSQWLARYELVERTAATAVYRLRPALRSGSAPRERKLSHSPGP